MPFYLCLKHEAFIDVNTLSSLLIYNYRSKNHQNSEKKGETTCLHTSAFFLFIELAFTLFVL